MVSEEATTRAQFMPIFHNEVQPPQFTSNVNTQKLQEDLHNNDESRVSDRDTTYGMVVYHEKDRLRFEELKEDETSHSGGLMG